MYQIFARIRLILAALTGIFIFSIDDDLFLFAIGGCALVYFVFLSDRFFEESTKNLEKSLSKISAEKTSNIPDITQEKVTVGDTSQNIQEDVHVFPDFTKTEEAQDFTQTPVHQSIAVNDQQEYISKPREPNAIERFFSENLLAKLGGILVFLGVLFLLSLIYSVIGPVAKMCVGLAIGFSCYGAGVWMDKNGYEGESRIVMGTALLINYLVILSGRHLLGTDICQELVGGSCQKDMILSAGITFIFLILNTVFAVVTSLVYNSRPLLIFAFIFAYINPLLLGNPGNEPYTLLGYTLIVTAGAMFMAYTKKDEILFPMSFVLAALIFVNAPWMSAEGWIAKLLSINVLGAMSLYVSTVFEKKYQNLGEILIGGTFFLIGVMGFLGITSLTSVQFIIMGASSLGLMILCYFNMNKGTHLYSIGTLGTVLTLTPAILTNGLREDTLSISICIIGVFALCNIGVVLTKSKQLLAGNLGNIISGLVSGAIFLTFMLYEFGNIYFPGTTQGFAFFFLAIVYCLLAFLIVQKIGMQELKNDEKHQNTFYTISAIGISLFSLAVAFVFAEHKEIISIIWLLEAAVLFYLSNKTHSQKIALGALILFAIGIFQYISFIDMRIEKSYGLIVSCIIVFLTIFHTLYSVSEKGSVFRDNKTFLGVYTILHIIGIFSASLIIIIVSDINNEWISLLGAGSGAVALYYIYQYFQSQSLIFFSKFMILGVCLIHIIFVSMGIDFTSLDIILSLLILAVTLFPAIFDSLRSQKGVSRNFFSILGIYTFGVTSMYVYQLFDTTFAITLYWGLLSFLLLSYGISKNILPLRTLGLYLITLTAGKVFLYDIWMSVNDTVSRVIALIVVGILMIILSSMYTRKYGNNLNAEFAPSNLFGKDIFDAEIAKVNPDMPEQEKVVVGEKSESGVMQDIEKTDVSEYSAVRMKISGVDKTFTIRAVNLIKIAKIIETSLGKKVFAADELSDIQKSVLREYKSDLPESQFKKLKEVVAAFVKHGGEIEFIEKK